MFLISSKSLNAQVKVERSYQRLWDLTTRGIRSWRNNLSYDSNIDPFKGTSLLYRYRGNGIDDSPELDLKVKKEEVELEDILDLSLLRKF